MCCEVIKELFCFLHCIFGGFQLFACNSAESRQYREVDRACVIENATNYPLDMFYFIFEQWGRRVGGNWSLSVGPILSGLGGIWAMLWPCWHVMLVFLELLKDVPWHQDVQCSGVIIPLQFYATV